MSNGVDHKDLTSFVRGLAKEREAIRTHRGYRALKRIQNEVTRRAQENLTGPVLKVDTGRLRSSVRPGPIRRQGRAIVGSVGTNVFYGRVWEFGAHVPAYEIFPKDKKALRFMYKGKETFARRVKIPARDIQPRRWLGPAVKDSRPFMLREIGLAGLKMASGGRSKKK